MLSITLEIAYIDVFRHNKSFSNRGKASNSTKLQRYLYAILAIKMIGSYIFQMT